MFWFKSSTPILIIFNTCTFISLQVLYLWIFLRNCLQIPLVASFLLSNVSLLSRFTLRVIVLFHHVPINSLITVGEPWNFSWVGFFYCPEKGFLSVFQITKSLFELIPKNFPEVAFKSSQHRLKIYAPKFDMRDKLFYVVFVLARNFLERDNINSQNRPTSPYTISNSYIRLSYSPSITENFQLNYTLHCFPTRGAFPLNIPYFDIGYYTKHYKDDPKLCRSRKGGVQSIQNRIFN